MSPDTGNDFTHPTDAPPFLLGGRLVLPAECRIRWRERSAHVEPRVMKLLICLSDQAGRVMTRQQLLDAVWGQVVVCDDVLTRAVSDLRRALGDDSRRPALIETIPKHGYRLVGEIRPVAGDVGAVGASDEPLPGPAAPDRPAGRPRRLRGRLLAGVGLVLAALALAMVPHLLRDETGPPHDAPIPAPDYRPLTSAPGLEFQPAISPDGDRVAYVRGASLRETSIRLRDIASGRDVALTAASGDYACPAWSPDGAVVAFARIDGDRGVYAVDAAGGTPRLLVRDIVGREGLDWSPDGGTIAYTAVAHDDTAGRIVLLDPATRRRRALPGPDQATFGDSYPAFAPDGRTLAHVRVDAVGMGAIVLRDLVDGRVSVLPVALENVAGLDWLPDGAGLLCAGRDGGRSVLWRIDPTSGAATRLPCAGDLLASPSVAVATGRLVLASWTLEQNIAAVAVSDDPVRAGPPEPLVVSSRLDYGGEISPDGERIAFVSTRSGHEEIWICAADGQDARQRSACQGPAVTPPHWSPDGDRLCFAVHLQGRYTVQVGDLADGRIRTLPSASAEEIPLFWSADGRRIAVSAGAGRDWRTRWLDATTGERADFPPPRDDLIQPTPRGDRLYYICAADGSIQVLTDNGRPRLVVPAPVWHGPGRTFAPGAAGVYFVRDDADGRNLLYQGFDADAAERICVLPPHSGYHLTLSADGRTLLFDLAAAECDLILYDTLF